MSSDLDWVEEIRKRLAAVDEADRRLREAMTIDSMPAKEILAASTAEADLWNYAVSLHENHNF